MLCRPRRDAGYGLGTFKPRTLRDTKQVAIAHFSIILLRR